jgi:hypothetical protein
MWGRARLRITLTRACQVGHGLSLYISGASVLAERRAGARPILPPLPKPAKTR